MLQIANNVTWQSNLFNIPSILFVRGVLIIGVQSGEGDQEDAENPIGSLALSAIDASSYFHIYTRCPFKHSILLSVDRFPLLFKLLT